jgi:hypothetical protein
MDHNESLDHTCALPPLRIHHFLLAMTGVALVAVYQGWNGGPVFASDYRQFVAEIYRILSLILQTSAATTFFLLLKWRYHDRLQFEIEPGHWLLLLVTIEFVFTTLLGNLYVQLGDQVDFSHLAFVYDLFFRVLPQLLIAGACALAFQLNEKAHWKWLFIVICLIALSGALWLGIQLFPYGFMYGIFDLEWMPWWVHQPTSIFFAPAIQLFFLTKAVRSDQTANALRHWTHWCGVITWVAILLAFATMRACILVPLWF